MRTRLALLVVLAACGSPPPARVAEQHSPPGEPALAQAGPGWNALTQPASFSYAYWTVPPGFRRERVDLVHVSCTIDIPRRGARVVKCEPGGELRGDQGPSFDRFFACSMVRQIQPDSSLLRRAERALAADRAPESGRPQVVLVLSALTRKHEWIEATPAIEPRGPRWTPPACYRPRCPPVPIDDSPVHPTPAIPAHEEVREERVGPALPAPSRAVFPSGQIVLSEVMPERVVGNAFAYDTRVALNRADRGDAFFRDLDTLLRAFDPRGADPFERAAYHANQALLAVQRGDAHAALAELPALDEDRRAIADEHLPRSARSEQTMSAIASVAHALAPLAQPNVVLRDPCSFGPEEAVSGVTQAR